MARRILNGDAFPSTICSALLALLVIVPAPALLLLDINNAPEVYLPKTAPSVAFDNRLREEFPSDQILIALFEGEIFSNKFLAGLSEVTQQLQKHALVERVLSVFTLDHVAGNAEGFVVEPLLDKNNYENLSKNARRERVVNDRFAPDMLVARDGTGLALVVRPVQLNESRQSLALESALLHVIDEVDITSHLTAVAGQVALDAAQFRSMVRDTLIFVPATFILGLTLFWLMFRRVIAVAMGGIVMIAITGATVAIIAIMNQPYTLITAMIPSLMVALTAALLVHFFNALVLATQRGYYGELRVAWACRNIERPARFTALTTAAGLASLSLSPIPPIRTFGLSAAAGVLLIYFVCIVLLPPIFARWDTKPWYRQGTGLAWGHRFVSAISNIGIRYSGYIVLMIVLGLFWALPNMSKVHAETNMLKFFSEDHPLTESTHLVEEKLSGVTSLEIVFTGSRRDVFKNSDQLQNLKNVQSYLETLPEVDRTLSMMDILEEMNWAFHGEDESFRRIPDSSALISQYLLIYDGRDLYDLVDREFRQTRLLLSVNVHGSNDISALLDKIKQRLKMYSFDDLQWNIAGFGRLFGAQEDLLIQGQVHSLFGAIGLIFILLIVIWRSIPAAGLCMIPNISPLLVMFATMGMLGIWLDMATAMIASVAVGIAVDDTIHIYHVYRTHIKAGAQPVWALGRAYRQAGQAITITTLILCIQFAILIFSQFKPTAEFGFLTTLGLIAALLFDLLLLPAVLVLLYRWQKYASYSKLSEYS